MYNNNTPGNFLPPYAGGGGFPGFDRPGPNAYNFTGRTYNSSLEFNSSIPPVVAGSAGSYGAAVLKPAPPQSDEESDPVATEELAQQKAIEKTRREVELLDLTRQQKMQQLQEQYQEQQQQQQLLQQQQLQEQQQHQHRMDELPPPPPLFHADFQSRNLPQFHSGFVPPPAAPGRSGLHPPFKAGENYFPKRGAATSGG